MDNHSLRETAAVGLSLLDLTDLDASCTPEAIDRLCARAQTPFGNVAAICIQPRFVPRARLELGPSHAIRIATVVNFPDGEGEAADVVSEAREAIADGADEIDLVIPYRRLLSGDFAALEEVVQAVRQACPAPVVLKTVLETGTLKETALIERATLAAIDAGADFIKTSTGRAPIGVTLEAADIVLRAIRQRGGRVGFKPSGGIRTVADADLYLSLAGTILAPDWAMPSTFRFGASGLLDAFVAMLSGPFSSSRMTG